MKFLKRLSIRFLSIMGLLVLLYCLGLLLGALIPQNTHFRQGSPKHAVPIFIRSNGFHSFLILPVNSTARDWRNFFPLENFEGLDSSYTYISLGWGDRGFFMETPTWEDFSLQVALKALFLPSSSVIQVTYLSQAPTVDNRCIQLSLSPTAYRDICTYIEKSIDTSSQKIPLIPGKGYTPRDNFYEANGSYSLINTCNNWLNKGLSLAGVRTGRWTPIDKGLLYQLHKVPPPDSIQ